MKSRSRLEDAGIVAVVADDEAAVDGDAVILDLLDRVDVLVEALQFPVRAIDAVERAARLMDSRPIRIWRQPLRASRRSSSSSSAIEMSVSVNQRRSRSLNRGQELARPRTVGERVVVGQLEEGIAPHSSLMRLDLGDDLVDRLAAVLRAVELRRAAELAVERAAADGLHGDAVVLRGPAAARTWASGSCARS